MATIINLCIHPNIVRNPEITMRQLVADAREIMKRCSSDTEETIITWEHLFAVEQLCLTRNIKMHIRYTKDGKTHEHTGYSLDEYLWSQLFPEEEQPPEDQIIAKAKELFSRLGGIGNADARLVGALINRIENPQKK